MSFITWIHYLLGILVGIPKAILGIPKDIVELKKSKLEVTKLKAEERQRDFITPASLNDVGKYDPNVQKLEREIKRRRKLGYGASEVTKRVFERAMMEQMEHPTASVILVLIFLAIKEFCF